MNHIILSGRLGGDPVNKFTASGMEVSELNFGVRRKVKDQYETMWVNVIAFGSLAQRIGKELRKGDKAWIEGSLVVRNFVGRDGNKRYVTEVIADWAEWCKKVDEANDSPVRTGVISDTPEQKPNPVQIGLEPYELDLTEEDIPF